jgi:transcriptional regulator with XRE-family HTH domain
MLKKKKIYKKKDTYLRAIRKKLGLTGAQMADKIKISRSYYYNMDCGNVNVSKRIISLIEKIAEKKNIKININRLKKA